MPLKFADHAAEFYKVPLTIRHLLANTLLVGHNRTIHYRDDVSLTYEELFGRIGRLASMLSALGAGPGTTVAVMDWDSHRYLESYFAVPMMGAVLQTVNIRLPEPQIAYTIDHAEAEILLVHRDFFAMFEAIRHRLPRLRHVIALMDGEGGALPGWACGEYEALSACASPEFDFVDFDENAVATTFYTTGTTGNPKGVCFTHRQIVLQTLVSCGQFGVSDHCAGVGYQDVYMPLTPMFHVHAWGAPYVATMLGVTQIYPGRFDPVMVCKFKERFGVTYSHCVPTILQMILTASEDLGTDVRGWKIAIGGSSLSRKLFDAAYTRGLNVYAGYGMSETAPTLCKARRPVAPASHDEYVAAVIACGVPTPMVSVRIVDEDMNVLPNDGKAKGELIVRAPWITPCYVKDRTASDQLWRGGWMHTQDVASIDPTGTVRIRDRIKDVIKSGGEWIDSIELENLVASAGTIFEAAVVGIADAKWGERPLAIVVPEPGVRVSLDDLNAPVLAAIEKGAITRYARIESFEIVDALPRTSMGKIDKKALRARYC